MSRLGIALVTLSLAVPASAQQQRVDPTWLTFDSAAKTVRFELIAGLTGLNGALNFNGFRDGGLTLVVPVGWKTEIAFRNHDGMLPHSAAVRRTRDRSCLHVPALGGTSVGSDGRDALRRAASGGVSDFLWRAWARRRRNVDPTPCQRDGQDAGVAADATGSLKLRPECGVPEWPT